VDTGISGKGDEKFRSIYAIDRTSTLKGSLAAMGLKPDDITVVINTHLHFDHAGGNTFIDEGGMIRPAFPKARPSSRANGRRPTPNERTRASYRQEDFLPVMKGLFELSMEIRKL
jgi:glyoxylase-like metal-dependent hydrolase (beta-lactamase superfamily II)